MTSQNYDSQQPGSERPLTEVDRLVVRKAIIDGETGHLRLFLQAYGALSPEEREALNTKYREFLYEEKKKREANRRPRLV